MKPGLIVWAENDNYAGGPDIGLPTKAPYSAGQTADGYERNIIVSAQKWNSWRWSVAKKLKNLEIVAVKNWTEASHVIAVGAQPYIRHGSYDPANKIHWLIDKDGGGGSGNYHDEHQCRSLDSSGTALLPNDTIDAFSSGTLDVRVICCDAADYIAYSTALGAWAVWTGLGATGINFSKGHHDEIGRYCFLAKATCDIYTTTGTGIVPASTDTQFAAGNPCKILHSRHPAAKIYPDDAGNQIWLAVTNTEVNTSVDGVTWGTPANHGVANVGPPADMAYSAYGARWIIATPGIAGGLGTIAVSDDNGATWTSYDRLPYWLITTPTQMSVACDGFGVWVIAASENAGTAYVEYFFSVDNGETWDNCFIPKRYDRVDQQNIKVALWHGEGQFVTMENEYNSDNVRLYHTLTLER